MEWIALALFSTFILFQMLYIFIPLYTIKGNKDVKKLKVEKGFSILIPAFNEEKTILNCLQGIVNLNYKNFEAIFINDGSSDQTLELLTDYLDLRPLSRTSSTFTQFERINGFYQSEKHPNIFVLDKANGGKADALNAGIAYSLRKLVITLDADSILEPNALTVMNQAFEDKKVIAAGGMVQISQGFTGSHVKPKPVFNVPGLIRYQIIQYLTDFYLHKTTQAKLKSITVIAGAFGAFQKQALIEVNGYRKTVGEDLDITLRMHKLIKAKYKKHKLIFVPNACCYTECPENYRGLFSQRFRWQKGFIDCLIHFRKSYFKNLGIPVSIYILIDSLILGTLNAYPTMIIPIILLITKNYEMALFFLAITFLLALSRSMVAMVVAGRFGHHYSNWDKLKVSLFIPFEILTYRLLGLVFVTVGTILFFKNKNSWNRVDRVGMNKQNYGEGIRIPRKEVG
ncbi:Glycosyltransferase, catalytic subunit of cellulose synthase and poly-beta-1,6-N-acetylglucosamine synthase [Mesobacillus persicus]|uniref:Glycosyltransferase, catalytic subunit of cellulose synthase and poly-beta-1,6-N-acetylglucosamine synthase n=1 Tax=Mesobacillus persicus TaxID=930146 RepID=A0A1H8CIC4_9BACI|nr:glycosyltransferase [Mesobacillus persicus]SEM94028.1 Glycosyltransferase, catalytic subunit of cellulose synthase and poly-beta-1,6-N-acetylglucosamine synthase [Mesobacillus persicus]